MKNLVSAIVEGGIERSISFLEHHVNHIPWEAATGICAKLLASSILKDTGCNCKLFDVCDKCIIVKDVLSRSVDMWRAVVRQKEKA